MRKILISLAIIAAIGAIVITGTTAFFSDTETSTGNTFTAGAIDLKIDSQAHYNGMVCVNGTWQAEQDGTVPTGQYPEPGSECTTTWGQIVPGVDITGEKFFDYDDVKPGDFGENTISLHVINNDAWLCAEVSNLTSDDNGLTEPETSVETDLESGELDNTMLWKIWRDDGVGDGYDAGDNIWQPEEAILYSDNPSNTVLALYDSNTGPALLGGSTTYLGFSWSLPGVTGNEVQTDSLSADISFWAEQARNNPNFVCGSRQEPEINQLVLDNEDVNPDGGPWLTTPNDDIGGLLTWAGDGPTFYYSLTAHGLALNTPYSLIYYADPYPGNNPGKLIGTGLTDSSGDLAFSGNPDLGMDLPMPADLYYSTGAKIWLIPSANYDAGTNIVSPWAPDYTWLFEGNVYINYDDTDY